VTPQVQPVTNERQIPQALLHTDAEDQDQTPVAAVVGQRLSLEVFSQISGKLGGYPFVKVVVDLQSGEIHFINDAVFKFHADYISQRVLGFDSDKTDREIDDLNYSFYRDPDRRFYLAILSLHKQTDKQHQEKQFFILETVEVDTMEGDMLRDLYRRVRDQVDRSYTILLKPANHLQEAALAKIDVNEVPRIHPHSLFASAKFIPLNTGSVSGRIRCFNNHPEYNAKRSTLEWYDIIVMARVPDDIPRVSGIINSSYTTPLSHTNVLASGWQAPNCIDIGIVERVSKEGLDGQWVKYTVEGNRTEIGLERIERPAAFDRAPAWKTNKIQIEAPEVNNTQILPLTELRKTDRFRYGTKAANLGEVHHVLTRGSEKLNGFYRVRRAPRPNLLPYLAQLLDLPDNSALATGAWHFLRKFLHLPIGIAIPFSIQQRFFESSPRVQQAIGKLKMALELNAPQADALCVQLQKMIIETRFPDSLRDEIDRKIAEHLGGVSRFVVRSSSNAEDLQNFSAAGIYESINHVTTADRILESIKQVWASVLSPRSVRLRQEVGISLDDTYMGVIVQEEMAGTMGGVMVTSNPLNHEDFRNVFINVSKTSVQNVVDGTELPYQYLMNTVEGGGRTVSLGNAKEDLSDKEKAQIQKLALAGRLLQSHFSPDYTFSAPMDIEWLANGKDVYILQLRPYAT
jgi:hypothetical protein